MSLKESAPAASNSPPQKKGATINVAVPPELAHETRVLAAMQGITLAAHVRRAIERYNRKRAGALQGRAA